MPSPKILIVDDDADFVEATAVVLEANGYEVVRAYDSKEGLEKAKSELPQLIIIDLMMETINEGYIFCLNIREDERFKKVPLLMISSAHQTETFKNFHFVSDDVWFPISVFLDKPVDKETLLMHVTKHLGKRSMVSQSSH